MSRQVSLFRFDDGFHIMNLQRFGGWNHFRVTSAGMQIGVFRRVTRTGSENDVFKVSSSELKFKVHVRKQQPGNMKLTDLAASTPSTAQVNCKSVSQRQLNFGSHVTSPENRNTNAVESLLNCPLFGYSSKNLKKVHLNQTTTRMVTVG